MSEYVSLKKKDLLEVWEETDCEELAEALEGLYPDDLPPKAEEKDVTGEIEFEYLGDDFFVIKHNGREIARQSYRSKINKKQLIIEFNTDIEGGYRFELAGGNWRVIKKDGHGS